MVRILKVVLLLSLTILFSETNTIFAANGSDVRWSIGCSGFESQGGVIRTDRDNTGNNQEAFTITAYDGFGNVIYGPEQRRFIVGAGVVLAEGEFQAWDRQPQANPLIVTVTSLAGNGLEEQVASRVAGQCVLLDQQVSPPRQLIGVAAFNDADGTTSPAVPIGVVPPSPAGINNIAQLLDLPGYGIVNTPRLNMRTGAGRQYTRIAILDGGTELIILGRNRDASWWYVQVENQRGWVGADFIILRGDLRGANILPGIGEVEPARFILYRQSLLYTGPSERADVICTIPGNIEYPIIGRDAQMDWYQIRAFCNGTMITGWINTTGGAFRSNSGIRVPVTN